MTNKLPIAMNWYRFAHNTAQWDHLISLLADRLGAKGIDAASPAHLGDTHALIQSGDFAIAYCCGIDAYRFRDLVTPIASPIYSHTAKPGLYRSMAVTNANNAVNALVEIKPNQVIVNQRFSWSGGLVARRTLEGLASTPCSLNEAWQSWPVSGGHGKTLDFLAREHQGLVGFVDENSWHLNRDRQSQANPHDRLKIIGETAWMPACPLVVPRGRPEIAQALCDILPKLTGEPMDQLGLKGFHLADPEFWLEPFAAAAKDLE